MGSDARGAAAERSLARHDHASDATARGRKLVVQVVETFHKGGQQSIVDTLDAIAVGNKAGMPIAPVMIYGDDVTHVVTEEGIAYPLPDR